MPIDPFVVPVSRLRRAPGSVVHEVRVGPADPRGELHSDAGWSSGLPTDASASCDVALEACMDGSVAVKGTVRAPWTGMCRRCATPVGGELVIHVVERYVEPRNGELEDEEAYPLVDDRVDLRPLVHDAIVLELPLAPVCSPDCRGLCPTCGADWNHESCDCVPPRDPRWASLDVLRSPS
jgi:uncharacterized protein